MGGNSRSVKGTVVAWTGGESSEGRVAAKTREDQIRLKVIMYSSEAVAIDEKDRSGIQEDLTVLEQRTKVELIRNHVNIKKIKLIDYQVIGNIQEQGRFIL